MFLAGRNSSNNVPINVISSDDVVENPNLAMEDGNILNDVYVEEVPTQKPCILDDDNDDDAVAQSSDLEESFCGADRCDKKLNEIENNGNSIPRKAEKLNVDKKYEIDGEISDCELAVSGYTKKEFTQDDNTLNLDSGGLRPPMERPKLRKKHFVGENRSLDRNFERQQQQNENSISISPVISMLGGGDPLKTALDRSGGCFAAVSSEGRLSRERTIKKAAAAPSYALSRFLSSQSSSMPPPPTGSSSQSERLSKGVFWSSAEQFDENNVVVGDTMLCSSGAYSNHDLVDVEVESVGLKVECVYSLLSMLGSNDPLNMSKKFLELSRTPEACATLRRSGCIPLLVQMMHSADAEDNVRKCASMALHNVIHSNPDERAGRREAKVLRHLYQITDYCNFLKTLLQSGGEAIADDNDRHPLAAISSLMKVSFDEDHRHAMCELGALHTIPNLVHLDHAVHGPNPPNSEKNSPESDDGGMVDKTAGGSNMAKEGNIEQACNSLRRYALMALTNLTFGDEKNKALLCSQKPFMEALVAQLESAPDDLLQVTASVLRNLSWRADSSMKSVLNEIGTVTALARAAMKNRNENTLKAILSALWNLSAHCSTNKAEFCSVDGALAFLVDMLTYEGPSKTLKIIENAGGILRNVSSHIAVRENYRQILRERNCLAILLQQLKSESLTVVSNSCGTLWNLSARCPEDQKFLWDNGAVPMLRSLIHSKHAMISEGSSSALKNLLNFRPSAHNHAQLDPIARSMGLKKLPTLNARKQRALELELDAKVHSETCENLEDILHNTFGGRGRGRRRLDDDSSTRSKENGDEKDAAAPIHTAAGRRHPLSAPASTTATHRRRHNHRSTTMLTKSESRDSIFSAKSDSVYENVLRSHSASDTNRIKIKSKITTTTTTNYATTQRVVYDLDNNVESNDDIEQPIDYSIKYNESSSSSSSSNCKPIEALSESSKIKGQGQVRPTTAACETAGGGGGIYSEYRETDLDQPTNFSLRYAENQAESDADLINKIEVSANVTVIPKTTTTTTSTLLEDSVKCYQTEGTPYVISNAASITDLRQNSSSNKIGPIKCAPAAAEIIPNESITNNKTQLLRQQPQQQQNIVKTTASFVSGSYTPEKPINYCEEGTPGYFSRYDSLSSLDESPPPMHNKNTTTGSANKNVNKTQLQNLPPPEDIAPEEISKTRISGKSETKQQIKNLNDTSAPKGTTTTTMTMTTTTTTTTTTTSSNINSAQETPLMFSRHSSMDSLIAEDDEEDVVQCDDKSSVVSEFSRLASGVISPSEIPDSPTQSMPQSPRRSSDDAALGYHCHANESVSPINSRNNTHTGGVGVTGGSVAHHHRSGLRSVFEDDLNTFHVENTPAQFSCATSLSNLSIIDDAPHAAALPSAGEAGDEKRRLEKTQFEDGGLVDGLQNMSLQGGNAVIVSEGEEESTKNNDDDILLANCINMGMHRSTASNTKKTMVNEGKTTTGRPQTNFHEATKQYCTEDTPALLSKVASNSNLSAISICSSNAAANISSSKVEQRHSLNLSDDVSSNASESGAGGVAEQTLDILQQCIRDGMEKKPSNRNATTTTTGSMRLKRNGNATEIVVDPIAMMRRGGSALPRYLPVADETNKYLVEDSPCNFSVVSGLSNLTVGSSLVGSVNAVQLDENDEIRKRQEPSASNAENATAENNYRDDSLSSLSIESEDDSNLLSQAIAAGCNRPKSNLGFSSSHTSIIGNKYSNSSLSASQPIPTGAGGVNHSKRQQLAADKGRRNSQNENHLNGNESYSSVDSSDSNDNQSKSLLELCILTGMHKSSRDNARNRHHNLHHHHHHNHNRAPLAFTALNAAASTQSNPNLKQFDSLPSRLNAAAAATTTTTRHHTKQSSLGATPTNRQRDRERKDEKLLQECIYTGISKKISSSGASSHHKSSFKAAMPATGMNDNINVENQSLGKDCAMMMNCVQLCPKNVQATSVVASDVEAAESESASSIKTNTIHHTTVATDVEKAQANNPMPQQQQQQFQQDIITSITNNINIDQPQNKKLHDYRRLDDTIDDQKNQVKRNDIGYYEEPQNEMKSLEKANSVDSNESFTIETTISFMDNQPLSQSQNNFSSMVATEKHKDPDLMLKSVERLTLEFVSSAEQFLTLSQSTPKKETPQRKESLSIGSGGGGGASNNTWNEDTHPNDISFPSISVTIPIVNSLTYEDDHDNDDDDDELATRASDHNELHDFAEITPTNDEQTQLNSLLCSIEDEVDVLSATGGITTPQMDTLINHAADVMENNDDDDGNDDISSFGGGAANHCTINFKLGGAVQTAALTSNHVSSRTFSYNSMTNSTLFANEARTIAENLLKFNNEEEEDEDEEELTFSGGINSLDLDNIRPPSGMESLNISGYYHLGGHPPATQTSSQYQQNQTQPNSLQKYTPKSPQLCTKSPKFLRKALPAGLVARRALGHFTGSAESVNSSFNLLDNIKPPSLMDELLDSMISVSSIQSEIVDDCCESMATAVSVSNYETATAADGDGGENDLNYFDDNTITLLSCCDILPCDGDGDDDGDEKTANSGRVNDERSNPLETENDNFSSFQSTAQKSQSQTPESPDHQSEKRSLTPKIRRKLSKDRFKTYTIAAVQQAIDQNTELHPNAPETPPPPDAEEEVLTIEIVESENQLEHTSFSARRRRRSCDRYKTQTIVYPTAVTQNRDVDRCRTAELYIDEEALNSLTSTNDCTSEEMSIRTVTKAKMHTPEAEDYNSAEFEQNSETESCHDASKDEEEVKPPPLATNEIEQTKIVRGRKKVPYVSPYSMQYQRSKTAAPVSNGGPTVSNRPTKSATFLRKRNTTPSTAGAAAVDANSHSKKKKKNALVSGEQPTNLTRQGTFVKDEPTLGAGNMPIVEAEAEAEAVSPTSSKQHPTKSAQSSPKRLISRLPTKRTAGGSLPPFESSASRISTVRRNMSTPPRPQRSNSNNNIRTASAVSVARSAALSARVSSTTPPSRSNSIVNTNESGTTNRMPQPTTQSRIASIWKQKTNTNTTNTIQGTSSRNVGNVSNLRAQHTKSSNALNSKQKQFIRSLTFHNSPTKATATATATAVSTATTKTTNSISKSTPRSAGIAAGSKFAVHKSLIGNANRNETRAAAAARK